jgi:hypothetical protein
VSGELISKWHTTKLAQHWYGFIHIMPTGNASNTKKTMYLVPVAIKWQKDPACKMQTSLHVLIAWSNQFLFPNTLSSWHSNVTKKRGLHLDHLLWKVLLHFGEVEHLWKEHKMWTQCSAYRAASSRWIIKLLSQFPCKWKMSKMRKIQLLSLEGYVRIKSGHLYERAL